MEGLQRDRDILGAFFVVALREERENE